ncbi:MAG: hypothetical protein H6809_04400 [Phycisphaeraceae bacterium]|nr:hypothetical protein [Phycisphaeraceae bacterium]
MSHRPTLATSLAPLVLAALALSRPASAQPSALVVTNLTDPVSGTTLASIAPSQTLRMRTRVSWQGGVQMAGIAGDMLVTPLTPGGGEGVPANRYSEYAVGALVSLGAFAGDDLLGIDIAVTPAFFQGGWIIPPSYSSNGIDFIGFDWTAPSEPGEYAFRFQPSALAPNLRVYPTTVSPAFIEVPTTYIAASVTVIPTPAAVPLLVLAAASTSSRRRRLA